jgi:hypothetical protein
MRTKAKQRAEKQKDDPRPSEVLRAVIQELLDSGVTLYRIATDARVAWNSVQRFMLSQPSPAGHTFRNELDRARPIRGLISDLF